MHPHFIEGDFRVGGVIRRSASMLWRHFLTFFIAILVPYSESRWQGH